MLYYPVVYFPYVSKTKGTTFINSIVLCPITLRTMIFKGKVVVGTVDEAMTIYLRHIDSGDIFSLTRPFIGKTTHILRRSCKIMNLRDLYMFVSDPVYIVIDKVSFNPIVPLVYIESTLDISGNVLLTKYHPKTLVHIIQYYSTTQQEYRHTVLIGSDASVNYVSGYNYNKSGLMSYLNAYKDELEQKNAYIFPIFWYAVEKLYPNAKLINL